MTSKVTKGRVFYGWFALAGAMLVIFVVAGAFSYSYGVFLPVMCQDSGWSRASVGAGLSLGFLAFGLPSPLFGVMVARFGPRFNIILGNTLAAVGLAGMFLVKEVWHIYLLYGFTGLTAGIGGYIAGSAVANNWFIKKRPLALGMFNSCGGLGGFVFAPMTRALISSIGWRESWLVLGGIVFVVASLIGGVILIRNRPEDMGQSPDGVPAEPSAGGSAMEYPVEGDMGQVKMRAYQALRMPTTWLLMIFAATNAFVMGTMSAHQVAYIQDLGFTPMTAAMTMSVVAVSVVIGSLGLGALALRFNIRYLASASAVVQLMALGILLTTKNLTFIYFYAVLMGIGHGAVITAMLIFVGAYYGRENYARVLGTIMPFQFIFQAAAPVIAGAIFDATTTYIPAFIVASALGLVGLVSALLARRPELPQMHG